MINRMGLLCATALEILVFSSNASAQLDEVVVTATKREQALQDTSVAVTVATSAAIEQAQIHDLIDLQSVVPSLRINQLASSTSTSFEIRGFGGGSTNVGIEQSVGVFIDGVYRSRSAAQIGDLLEVERIEVLRGPQSTLFGQNASAGVISIVSKRPSFEFGGDVEVGFGNFNARTLAARVTGPLSDALAISVAGLYNERDGYFANLADGTKIADRKRWSLQGQLLFKPAGTLTLRLLADTSSIDELCCGVSNLLNGPTGAAVQAVGGKIYTGSPYDRRMYFNFDPSNNVDNSGISVHVDWDLQRVRLTSITAYREQKAQYAYDADFTSADLVSDLNDQRLHTFTEEVRLASNADGSLSWMAGGCYLDESVTYSNAVDYGASFRNYADLLIGSPMVLHGLESALGLPAGTFFAQGQGLAVDTRQTSRTATLFGQSDWRATDNLTLTAGAAWTDNKKDVGVLQNATDVFSSLDFVRIGFGGAFAALTGLPPSPANIAAHPTQAGQADFISVTPCSASHPPPACNSALALYPLQFLPPVVPFNDGRSNDSDTTYTLRLTYGLGRSVNLYGGVSTGFKASSWNLSIDSKPVAPLSPDRSPLRGYVNPYYGRYGTRFADPEHSTVYEVGLKGQWTMLAVNLAVFDQAIKGFQTNVFTGTGFNLANAGKQTTKGVELEVQFKPNERWEVSFGGTFMDPIYDSFVGASGVNGPTDLSGQRPAGIHGQVIVSAVTYHWRASAVNGFIRVDGIYGDDVQVIDNVPASVASQKISTLNASTGMSLFGWDAALWCRNLNNDSYLLSAFPSVGQAGSYSGYVNQPRTYGLTLGKRF